MKKMLGPAFFSCEPPDARAAVPPGGTPIGPGTPEGTPIGVPGVGGAIGDGPPGGGSPCPPGTPLGASSAGFGPPGKVGPGGVPPSAGPPAGNFGASRAGAGPAGAGDIPRAGVEGMEGLNAGPPGGVALGMGGKPGV